MKIRYIKNTNLRNINDVIEMNDWLAVEEIKSGLAVSEEKPISSESVIEEKLFITKRKYKKSKKSERKSKGK